MLADYFKCPVDLISFVHNAAHYTEKGLLIWGSLKFERMRFVRREYGENPKAIIEAMNDPDKAVILEVNNKSHWVVGVKKQLLGNDYIVIDPIGGVKRLCKEKYKNVTGAAYFERIPWIENALRPIVFTTKKLIKSAGSADVFVYNGQTKHLIPDWQTKVFLFGDVSDDIEILPDEQMARIPTGATLPSLK